MKLEQLSLTRIDSSILLDKLNNIKKILITYIYTFTIKIVLLVEKITKVLESGDKLWIGYVSMILLLYPLQKSIKTSTGAQQSYFRR